MESFRIKTFGLRPLSAAGLFFLVFSFLLAPVPVSAHKYHTSLTRIDYNETEKSAEITIQVFTDDIENGFGKKLGKKVILDKTPKIDEIALAYFTERLIIKNKDGDTRPLRWVGLEQETDVTHFYFEAAMPDGFEGATIDVDVLQELFSDQVNLVTSRFKDRKTDLLFRTNDGAQNLVFKE